MSSAIPDNFSRQVPAGDNRHRLVCESCGWVVYEKPKIVVGTVVKHDGGFLLCRRAINPRKGFWTLPAGYLENHETAEAGARREAWEEARARLEIDALLAVYSITRISQVQLIYRGTLAAPEVSAGEETEAVSFFAWHEIPWDEIAFPSVHWALRHYREVEGVARFAPFSNPPGEKPEMSGL